MERNHRLRTIIRHEIVRLIHFQGLPFYITLKIISIYKMEYENMTVPELKSLARDRGLRNYSRMRKAELAALLQNNGTPEGPRAPAPTPPPQRCTAYVTLKFDDNGCCKIHSAKRGVSDGDKEIVPNERYFVMPWRMVNVDGKRDSLAEAVDEIFSKRDELTNYSKYVTLKLYDKGSCRIHRVSDGDKEMVTNERYVVMSWKAVNMHGKNMALKEAVHKIISRHESEAKEIERRKAEQNITKRI